MLEKINKISEDEMPNTGSATIAETTVPDLGIPYESCLTEGNPEPCIIVIFGASGDLTARKIVPALFNFGKQLFLFFSSSTCMGLSPLNENMPF